MNISRRMLSISFKRRGNMYSILPRLGAGLMQNWDFFLRLHPFRRERCPANNQPTSLHT